jgi:hypothetical protein
MNRVRKEQLKERIEKLDPEEQLQIFELIKRYTSEYTMTQTGALVSSESITDECMLEIEKMVFYYNDQRKRMDVETAERKRMATKRK